MSGPNSATASAAYARTRHRRVEPGDLVMIHANTCADGYWTDITRTYTAGEPLAPPGPPCIPPSTRPAQAALRRRPPRRHGQRGRPRRPRRHERHGFGEAFRHGTGHGVGFAAITAEPCPASTPLTLTPSKRHDFNVEPAAYFDGYGGMRHCDVVAVTANGAEVLTDF